MKELENLTRLLAKLPGVGPKSASRIAFSLIGTKKEFNSLLAKSIETIQDKIHPCPICGSFTEDETCSVCSDPTRDRSQLCIVEQPQDVISIQSSGAYNGLFHVLGGAINPLGKIGPEDLSFDQLLKRIRKGQFNEVIIATNPTEEGDTTALFVKHLLKEFDQISITRLASGLPIGGDLEYADRVTLARSFRNRGSNY